MNQEEFPVSRAQYESPRLEAHGPLQVIVGSHCPPGLVEVLGACITRGNDNPPPGNNP